MQRASLISKAGRALCTTHTATVFIAMYQPLTIVNISCLQKIALQPRWYVNIPLSRIFSGKRLAWEILRLVFRLAIKVRKWTFATTNLSGWQIIRLEWNIHLYLELIYSGVVFLLQISVFIFNKYYTNSFIFIVFISFVAFSHVSQIEVQTSQTCVQSKFYSVISFTLAYHAQKTHDKVCQVKERNA